MLPSTPRIEDDGLIEDDVLTENGSSTPRIGEAEWGSKGISRQASAVPILPDNPYCQ